VCSIVKNWDENKRNVRMVGQSNNQMVTPTPAHEWKHAHIISKGTFTGSKTNFCLCKQFATNLLPKDVTPNNFFNVAMV
jgi:hypothetical protein